MGQATIISQTGNTAEYLAKIEMGQKELLGEIDRLKDQAAKAGERLEKMDLELVVLNASASQAESSLNNAIDNFSTATATSEQVKEITGLQVALIEAQAAVQQKEMDIKFQKFVQAAATREATRLEGKYTALDQPRPVWCATHTTTLKPGDEVSTIEVNAEAKQILIAPGGEKPGLYRPHGPGP